MRSVPFLATLLLMTSLAVAQTSPAPQPLTPAPLPLTPAPLPTTDLTAQAKAFAAQMILVSDAVCTKAPLDAGVYACTAPINLGITAEPFAFLCTSDLGCWVATPPAPMSSVTPR